jgi:hypothetical protein
MYARVACAEVLGVKHAHLLPWWWCYGKQGLNGGFGGPLARFSASGMTKLEGNLCGVSGEAECVRVEVKVM